MKILQINKYLYPKGGSETYMFQLSDALKQLGHEVKFWGMEHPDNIVNDFDKLNIPFIDYHKQNSVEKLKSVFKTVYSFENKSRINKVLDIFQPDIVHLHNYNFQITPSILPEIKKKGIKIVHTAHDSQMVCPNHRLYNPTLENVCTLCVEKSFLNSFRYRCFDNSLLKSAVGASESLLYHSLHYYDKYVDAVIAPGNFMAKLLQKRLKKKVIVIPNFAAIEFVSNELPKNDYHLYYGRISEDKGISELIENYALNEIPLKIIGQGPYQDTMIKRIEKYPNISYLGPKYGKQLFEYVYHAKYIVQLAKSYENCPLSVVEAFAMGKPVIVSKHSGFLDLVEEGKTGFFIENTADYIKNKSTLLALNHFPTQELKQNILDFYTKNLNKSIHLEKLLQVYYAIL